MQHEMISSILDIINHMDDTACTVPELLKYIVPTALEKILNISKVQGLSSAF